jgi:hypothetical protein
MSHLKLLGVLGFLGFTTVAVAADAPPPPPDAVPLTSSFDARWLDDLRSDDFQLRQQATKRLFEAGEPAVGPIRDAISHMDHESATRAIEVLDKLSQNADQTTKAAATEALKTLEESEIPAVASLARSVRVKHEPPPDPVDTPFGRGGLVLRGGFNIRAGGQFQMRVQTLNGERTAKMSEPGKKIELTDSNGKSIRIRVTETVDGKEKTTEYAAKDADDLATKHPEAVPIYERLTQEPQGIPFPGGLNVIQQKMPGFDPRNVETKKEMDAMLKKYRDLARRRAELRLAGEPDEEAQKEMDQAKQEMKDLVEKLRR